MAYYFLGPIVEEGPAGGGRLFVRFRLSRGVTVMRTNNVWEEIRYPTEDQTRAADTVLWGGRKNYITSDLRDQLIANGYGQYIFEE